MRVDKNIFNVNCILRLLPILMVIKNLTTTFIKWVKKT